MAGSPPATVCRQGVRAPAAAARGLGRRCGRPLQILSGQKKRADAIGAASLDAANQRFLAGVFIGVGETLAVAGGEI